MSLGEALSNLSGDQIQWSVILLVIGLGVLDFVLGVLRAIADSSTTFDPGLVDVWVRKQLAGRILPITLVLIFSAIAPDVKLGDFSINVLAVAGNVAAAAYAVATTKSIIDSLNAGTPDVPPSE